MANIMAIPIPSNDQGCRLRARAQAERHVRYHIIRICSGFARGEFEDDSGIDPGVPCRPVEPSLVGSLEIGIEDAALIREVFAWSGA